MEDAIEERLKRAGGRQEREKERRTLALALALELTHGNRNRDGDRDLIGGPAPALPVDLSSRGGPKPSAR